jgi:hypothetical protein
LFSLTDFANIVPLLCYGRYLILIGRFLYRSGFGAMAMFHHPQITPQFLIANP